MIAVVSMVRGTTDLRHRSWGETAAMGPCRTDAGVQACTLCCAMLCGAGIVTSTMTGLLSQARLYVVLGRQCLLPSWLARVHKTRGTPVQATLVTAVFAGIAPSAAAPQPQPLTALLPHPGSARYSSAAPTCVTAAAPLQ